MAKRAKGSPSAQDGYPFRITRFCQGRFWRRGVGRLLFRDRSRPTPGRNPARNPRGIGYLRDTAPIGRGHLSEGGLRQDGAPQTLRCRRQPRPRAEDMDLDRDIPTPSRERGPASPGDLRPQPRLRGWGRARCFPLGKGRGVAAVGPQSGRLPCQGGARDGQAGTRPLGKRTKGRHDLRFATG